MLLTGIKNKSFLAEICMLLPMLTATVAAEQTAIAVTTESIGELAYQPLNSAPATTLSLNDSRVSPQTSGYILSLPVRVGEQVEAGQLLAELDCTVNISRQKRAKAALESAQARVDLARRQIVRTKALRKERNIAEEILDQRESDLETAHAELDQATAGLEETRHAVRHCSITAPFKGVVTERLAAEGEWVVPGATLVRLLDTERLEVSAQIPLDQIDSLRQAKFPELLVGNERYPLSLRLMLPTVDQRGRNREARFDFTGNAALPGSSGRLQWLDSQFHLPADIPVRRQEKLGVLLELNGRARFHPLPHALEGHPAAIDLPPKTQVILTGRQKVEDGDIVQIVDQDQDKP